MSKEFVLQLELKLIRLDGATQPRAEIDADTVQQYRERMEEGDKFPPVDVFYDGTDYWLADGFHRVQAAKLADWLKIDANVRQGTQRDAQWFSFGVNKEHGKRREKGDATRAITAILSDPEWSAISQAKIASHVGVSAQLVSQVKLSIKSLIDKPDARTVTRNGKTFEMNTANIGRKSTGAGPLSPPTDEQIAENKALADDLLPPLSRSGKPSARAHISDDGDDEIDHDTGKPYPPLPPEDPRADALNDPERKLSAAMEEVRGIVLGLRDEGIIRQIAKLPARVKARAFRDIRETISYVSELAKEVEVSGDKAA